ncbi:MAG: hypothetical protein ACOYOA_16585 [Saprospiraceae bacterium]
MKYFIVICMILVCWGNLYDASAQHLTNRQIEDLKTDSNLVATTSLGFYNWYLSCLKHDSTYNIIQPLYHWHDKIPVIETNEYIMRLEEMHLVSETFINFEKERFRICQDSLNHIDFDAVLKDGGPIGYYYDECYFIESYYWLASQEYPDSCEIKKIDINGNIATCQLLFFWNSENSLGKQYDTNFYCCLKLRKYAKNWRIDSIDIKRN